MTAPPPPDSFERRPLGAFGESVSALGLGLGALARGGADAPWDEVVSLAIERGVTSLDAAPAQARFLSEERLGRLLEGRRDAVFLSTRSTPLDGSGSPSRAAARLRRFDTRASAVRTQLEASLERLRTDRIDLFYAHDVEASSPRALLERTLPELVAARERGDVRYIGASGASLEVLLDIVQSFPVDAVLSYARLDLANVELLEDLLPEAARRGVAVINAAPLHMGLLADERVARNAVESGEHGGDDPLVGATLRAFALARERGFELAELALRFAAAEERIATTIVGCGNSEELLTALRAFREPDSDAETAAIAELRRLFADLPT